MGKTRIVLVSVISLIAVVAAIAWRHHTSTPEYALGQLRAALHDRNRLAVEERIDIGKLSESAVDAFLATASSKALHDSDSGWGALGAALGMAMMRQMRPALIQSFKSAATHGIESGRWDLSADPSTDGDEANVLKSMSSSLRPSPDKGFDAHVTSHQGSRAIVDVSFHEPYVDTAVVLSLVMERVPETGWKITDAADLTGFVAELDRLQDVRLAAINDSLSDVMNRAISVGPVHASKREISMFNEKLMATASVQNVGDAPVHTIAFELVDAAGKPLGSDVILGVFDTIQPGKTGQAMGLWDYNMFEAWQSTILEGEVTAKPKLIVVDRSTGADTLFRYGTWAEWAAKH